MFITVFTQVSVLMLMIAAGFIAAKTGIMTEAGAACCTDIALIIATPCVIIKSLMRRFDAAVMKSLLLAVVLTLLVQVLMIYSRHAAASLKGLKAAANPAFRLDFRKLRVYVAAAAGGNAGG